ncbi:hypothetical protein QL285_051935 [Trifolium repens]|nr:hypothetical protein QL285_051935 [Trifolium repens]
MLPLLHQFLAHGAAFWIPMGRSLLIRDRKSESTGIFVSRVDVFFGGLEAEECPSKNEIRCGPLLGGVCFGFIHWCSAYIRRLCFVVPFFPISVHLVRKLVINNNIFAVKNK